MAVERRHMSQTHARVYGGRLDGKVVRIVGDRMLVPNPRRVKLDYDPEGFPLSVPVDSVEEYRLGRLARAHRETDALVYYVYVFEKETGSA